MDRGLQWYKRDPVAFLDGVQGLGPDKIGAYSVLLDLMYARGGRTVRDDRHLSGILGCSLRQATALTNALIEAGKVEEHDGTLSNKRVQEVVKPWKDLREKRAEAGRKGGEARAKRAREDDETNLKLTQNGADSCTGLLNINDLTEANASSKRQADKTRKEENRNNSSEDKSSLLLSARTARDDDDNLQKKDEGGLQRGLPPDASPEPPPDHYQRFLAAHPRPRETDRGEDAWDEAIASGVDPETILNAARRYARVSTTYDRDKVKFSDNWLIEQAWERYPAPTGMAQQAELSAAERQRLSDEKQAEFIKSGKRFFCTGISAVKGRDLIAKGLVTQAECESVGVL